MTQQAGAVITQGPRDWQIFQQDSSGKAQIAVAGTWQERKADNNPTKVGKVQMRLVREDNNMAVAPHLDWHNVSSTPNGKWSGVLKDVPAGGMYRLETRLVIQSPIFWAQRGDIRHFLGVGDLWVIAGQSNSSGYGQGPVVDPPEPGVHLFNNAMRWALATHPLNDATDSPLRANSEWGYFGHAPWLHWARRIKQAMGYPIGLVQTSLGGSPLVSWNPTEKGEHPLYEIMLDCVKAVGGKVRGVLWYQGCSDTSQGQTYEKRFTGAVKAWRKALKLPKLEVLTVQLNRVTAPVEDDKHRGWSEVREAQRRASKGLPGVIVIPTLDLPMSDVVHNSAMGNILLAERAADAVLGAFYGKHTDWEAPEISAARPADRGMTLNLFFDHVRSYLQTTDMLAIPFRVQDAQGVVDIEKMEFDPVKSPNMARLRLKRALSGKAVVSGAYGCYPPTPIHDWDRLMPMLGFLDFPVGGK